MTTGLLRRASTFTRAHGRKLFNAPTSASALRQSRRSLTNAQGKESTFPEVWFNSSAGCMAPAGSIDSNNEPPDERTLKLGKTIRILHERLPTLLNSPLPQEILSPRITLHLFPSTHPHLPTVKGKIAYTAALWTAPVAWGRIPVLGNVKLIIMSERMIRHGGKMVSADMRHEKLIVRWKTCSKSRNQGGNKVYRGISASEHVDKVTDILRNGPKDEEEEFRGLFIFEFDDEGRVARHTIEHAEEGGNWEKMTKVVSVTDWLLGRAWGKKAEEEVTPGLVLGFCADTRRTSVRLHKRQQH